MRWSRKENGTFTILVFAVCAHSTIYKKNSEEISFCYNFIVAVVNKITWRWKSLLYDENEEANNDCRVEDDFVSPQGNSLHFKYSQWLCMVDILWVITAAIHPLLSTGKFPLNPFSIHFLDTVIYAHKFWRSKRKEEKSSESKTSWTFYEMKIHFFHTSTQRRRRIYGNGEWKLFHDIPLDREKSFVHLFDLVDIHL